MPKNEKKILIFPTLALPSSGLRVVVISNLSAIAPLLNIFIIYDKKQKNNIHLLRLINKVFLLAFYKVFW